MARRVREVPRSRSTIGAADQRGTVVIVLTCDYNGWNDAPEEEREWFDQHPEIWGAASRENELRPYRVSRTRASPRYKGDMAA